MTVTIEQRRGGMRIVGSGGGGKGSGGSARTPVEQPDSLHNTAYAAVLDVVGNGEMAGPVHRDEPLRDIYLNGTPIQNADGSLNFRNVQAEYRVGTQDQEHIAGFPAAASVTSVGREVGTTTPFTQLLTNPDLSAVRITLHWPQLMRMVDSGGNAGDRVGYRVEYAIDLAIGTGSFSEVLRTAADGKTVNGYTRTHRIELPPTSHGWTVRVRRLSPEPNDSAIQSKMMVQSYAEVIDGKFRYPMTALVGIKVDAEQFQSIPTRAYHWRGQIIRVPSNYDPVGRTYSGTWDGTFKRAWSNNPAWVFYDILTNKLYGLGDRIDASMVDRYALYQIGAYCDQLVPDGQGGSEPRFTCNAYIQSAVDALRLVNDLASTFRGMTYWANGQAVAVADMPSDPVYTYSNSKVAGGVFNCTGADLSTVSTVALVSWSDPSDFYRAKVEVVQDEAGIRLFGIRKTEITAFGCSSRGQAQRVGLYHLYTSLMEQGGISFAVGLEGVIPQPGSLIRIADANRSGRRNGGLVGAATARVVTLDADHSIKVGERLTVNLPSGKSQTRTVSGVTGRKVTVSTAFSEVPAAESSWSVDSDDLVTQLVRVISVKDVGGITFEISGVFHHPDKFNAIDNGVRLEPLPVSVVPPRVQSAPTNVRIAEHHTVRQGVSRHTAEVTWEAVEHATSYDLQWRRDSGDWVQVPRTGTRLVEISDIYSGSYLVRVRAINALDVPSLWAYSEPTELSGQVGQPPAVASLIASSMNWGIRLNWGFPTGPNIFERTEVRYGVSSEFAQSLPAGGFAYPTNQFEQTGLAVITEHFYWARLIDKNGTPGPWYPAENLPGVRGKPSQDAEGYNELVTKEIAEGALGELIMGNIHDIPNIRDTADSALAETGLQAQKIADNAQAIAKEILDRNTAVAGEAQARIDGQIVAAQALVDGLTAEASARGAAITQEKAERQAADASLAGRIDTVTASVGANTAAIQQEAQARASGDSAEANARQMLAAQLRGGYEGSDLAAVTSGFIAQEKAARTTQYEGLARQMTLLSAGVGEQFDYARMWYFTGSVEGWASATLVDGSWVRPTVHADPFMTSPAGLAVNGAEYTQARLRLRKIGNPTWRGFIGLYAPGNTGSSFTRFNIPEPTWDSDGIGVCVMNHSFLSEINQIAFSPGAATSAANHYLVDWIAVGRPAPGASSAALASEEQARATADAAEATKRESLSVKLIGKADPTGVTLPNVTSGLIFDERQARVSGDAAAMTEISGLKARMPAGTGKVATEASVTTEAQARATADSALAQRATALESRMPTGTGKVATADAVDTLTTAVQRNEQAITTESQRVTSLNNTVGALAGAAGNLLLDSNTEIVRSGLVYFIGRYRLSEGFVPNEKYTLVTCVSHSGVAGTAVGVWVGGSSQNAGEVARAATRSIKVTKFTKNSSNLSPRDLQFFFTPSPGNQAGEATIHWAALYKGDVVPPLEWQPNPAQIAESIQANASAVSALDTRVEQTEAKQTSTASEVTQLKTSVTTAQNTANNAQTSATAAQTAAQAASDKAGEKGEVIYSSTAPVAAKRLAQNLWIDTTGNANTPKRWNGTAWVAVTDKVATDAVAAAALAKADAAAAKAAADLAQQTANQKADASALTATNARVTAAEGKLTSAGESITRLDNSIASLAGAAGNLLKNSNREIVRGAGIYKIGEYRADKALEVGKTYTLVACITHEPAADDSISAVGAWAGSGMQTISFNLAKNAVKKIVVQKFVRNSVNPTAPTIEFYYYPNSVKTGAATIHWACLYDGDVVPPLEWQPSDAETAAAIAANATAVDGLTNRVTSAENGLTAAGQRSTVIEARIAADQDSDSLIPDYLMANPDCWYSHYGTDLSPRFVMTETGKIAPTVFRHTTGTSFNYSRTAIPTGTRYRVRFWARRSTDSNGQIHITMKNVRPNGSSGGSDYAAVDVRSSVPADEQWYLVDRVVQPSDATFSRVQFGFSANHTGSAGWAEIQGYRVTAVIGTADINPSEVATAQSVSSLSSTVSQLDGKVTSQGTSLTSLSNTINDPQTGLQATADALNQTNTKLDGTEKAVINQQNILQAGLRQIYAEEDAELDKALALWGSYAAIAETRQIVATEMLAMAEIVDVVRASLGGNSAAVQQTLQSLVELEGKMIAQWGVNVQLNVGGVPYIAGTSLGIVSEGGVTRSAFNVLADVFNVMHDVNGQPRAVFSVQNGVGIFNNALFGTASIKSGHIESLDALKIESENLATVLANIGTAYIDSAHMKQGSVKRLHVGVAEIDTLRVAGNAITVVGHTLSPPLYGAGTPATRDTKVSIWLPVASLIVIEVDVTQTAAVDGNYGSNYRTEIYNETAGVRLYDVYNNEVVGSTVSGTRFADLTIKHLISVGAGTTTIMVRQHRVGGNTMPNCSLRLEAFMR